MVRTPVANLTDTNLTPVANLTDTNLTAVVALAPAENQIKLDSAGKLGLEIAAGSSESSTLSERLEIEDRVNRAIMALKLEEIIILKEVEKEKENILKERFFYCQAQPQLNSTQLQLRLRWSIFPVNPATHPATHPPTRPEKYNWKQIGTQICCNPSPSLTQLSWFLPSLVPTPAPAELGARVALILVSSSHPTTHPHPHGKVYLAVHSI